MSTKPATTLAVARIKTLRITLQDMIHNRRIVESRSNVFRLLALVVALGVGACAGSDPYRPGESDIPRAAPNASGPSAPAAPVRWEYAAMVPSLKVLQDTFASRGHDVGALQARILGNDAAASAIDDLQPDDQMPRGAILVSQHTVRANGTADGLFAMIKREDGYFPDGGDWEWAVVGADGNVRTRGKLQPCARCHADAVADFVFPRTAPPDAGAP